MLSRYEQFMAEQRATREALRWLESFQSTARMLMLHAAGPVGPLHFAPRPGWVNR